MWTEERARLVHYAGRAGLRGDAEDVVQEAAIRLWNRVNSPELPPLEAGTPLYGYARRTVGNEAINASRKRSRRITARSLEPDDDPADDKPGPEGEAEYANLWHIVRTELTDGTTLGDQKVEILELHMNGASHQEVADKLDLPIGTVKSRMHYIKKKLAAAAEEGRFDGYV